MRSIGPYQIVGELGRGGAGVVLRAHDPRLRRDVAIKMLLAAKASEAQLKRFAREARALARVRHPNIVGVHEVGEDSGKPYIVMDLVEGTSLQARLDRDGSLGPKEAVSIIAKAARALAVAHEAGVLHRDLKPDNILVTAGGEPLLTDFGLAKDLDDPGRSNSVSVRGRFMGTPGFAAPEQAKGELVGPPTDVHGLGGTLFALLTGEPPFTGSSALEVIIATTSREAPAPSDRGAPSDAELDGLCARCLAKEPGDRFATAAELADACEGYLRGERSIGASAVRPAVGAVAARPASAVPRILLGVACSLALGFAASTAWVATRLREAERRNAAELAELRERLAAAEQSARVVAEAPAPGPASTPAPASASAAVTSATAAESSAPSEATGEEVLRLVASAGERRAAGDLSKAIEDYSKAIERGPTAGLLIDRGMIRADLHDLDGAIDDLSAAIGLDHARPDRIRALVVRLSSLRAAWSDQPRPEPRAVEDAWRLCVAGDAKFDADDVAGAMADYGAAMELDPLSAVPWHNRGLVRTHAGDLDGALADLDRAIELGVAVAEFHYIRGRANELRDDLAAARADYDRAIEADPLHQESWVSRSVVRRLLGDRGGARRDAERAVELDPTDADGYNARAFVRLAQGDPRGAIADLEEAIRLGHDQSAVLRTELERVRRLHSDWLGEPPSAPDQAEAKRWRERAESKLVAGDFEGALPDLDRALELDRTNAFAWANRGAAKEKAGDRAGAIDDASAAIVLSPGSGGAWRNRGLARGFQGDFVGAIADFDRAIALDPTDAMAWVARGAAHSDAGDLEEAIADYEEAVAQGHPESVDLQAQIADIRREIVAGPFDSERAVAAAARQWNRSGESRWAEGDRARAVEDFDKALRLDPTLVRARTNRGIARIHSGDTEGALADFDRVIDLDPTNVFALVNRGIARKAAGDLDGAIADCDRVIVLEPRRAQAWGGRGALKRDVGDLRGAIEDLNEAIRLGHPRAKELRSEVERLRARVGAGARPGG